jgi:hypothetical protein
MAVVVAEMIVRLAVAYAVAGALFAPLFVWRGVARLDPSAAGAGVAFRLLILPGAAAFWPLLAWRWLRGAGEPPLEQNAHRRAAARGAKSAATREAGR